MPACSVCSEPDAGAFDFTTLLADEHGDGHVLACDCATATEANCVVARENAPCAEESTTLDLDEEFVRIEVGDVSGELGDDEAEELRAACAG